jgi:hypothetical protein
MNEKINRLTNCKAIIPGEKLINNSGHLDGHLKTMKDLLFERKYKLKKFYIVI